MPDLRAYLQQIFERAGGAISFEDFMDLALYDSEIGYYATQIGEVGGIRSDFATSATLTNGLGRAISKWIKREIGDWQWHGKIDVVELGAGNGALAETVLRHFGFFGRRKIRYHIVEVSDPLRKLQEERLKRFEIVWHDDCRYALELSSGKAILISNEFVDAFPAKWLCWDEQSWKEVWVAFSIEEGLKEVFRPFHTETGDYSAFELPNPQLGQRIEVQPSYRKWLGEMNDRWLAGSILTIDYGGDPEQIYHRRPQGSVRGYFRQERVEGGEIYRRIGKQDLTVDVNFRDLRQWGDQLNWSTIWEGSQQEYLVHFGEKRDAMATSEAGRAFRVIHQRKSPRAD